MFSAALKEVVTSRLLGLELEAAEAVYKANPSEENEISLRYIRSLRERHVKDIRSTFRVVGGTDTIEEEKVTEEQTCGTSSDPEPT